MSPKSPTVAGTPPTRWQRHAQRLMRLAKRYRQGEHLQHLLLQISELAGSCRSMEQFYQSLVPLVKRVPAVENCYVILYDRLQDEYHCPFFLDQQDGDNPFQSCDQRQFRQGISHYLVRQNLPLRLDAEQIDALIEAGEVQQLGSRCEAWMGTPLRHQQEVMGLLAVQSYRRGSQFSVQDQEILNFVGQHLVATLNRLQQAEHTEITIERRTRELRLANQALHEEIRQRRRAEQLQNALLEITELTARRSHIDSFYLSIHRALRHLLHADNCMVALLNEAGTQIEFPYYEAGDTLPAPSARTPADGLVEQVLKQQQAVQLTGSDIQRAYRNGQLGQKIDRCLIQLRDWLGVPLTINGQTRGVLAVFSQQEGYGYDQKDLELLSFVSQHISTAIERRAHEEQQARYNEELERQVEERTREMQALNVDLQRQIIQRRKAEHQLRHDAFHDALTNLPNRALLLNRLDLALKRIRRHAQERFALLFIDLDRFKMVNDTLGHLAGDRFLKEIAQRLQICIRDNDTLARLGGDEFVILLDRIQDKQGVQEVCERILERVRQPIILEGREFFPGASIGIALADPHGELEPEALLRNADAALYQAKSAGRGCFAFFTSDLKLQMLNDLSRESQFRNALAQGEIQLYYQPMFDLERNRLVGVEALARWNHPKLGMIHPQQFLPWANKCGAVTELDRYVLSQVARDFAQIQAMVGEQGWVHINLDLAHLRSETRLLELEEAIADLPIPTRQLALEFSERDLLVDQQTLRNGLERLRQLGVKLGLDDFGTGYSALTMLPNLPLDFIKIDKQYCQQSTRCDRHKAIIQSLIDLSGHLGFTIAAEGIESESQRDQMRELGCRWGQGYYFNRPSELGQIEPLPACTNL
ncbi:bifunctional diguanylate cyclase/phosphodiesterase [Ferrimonas marina]|uniref:Diguanylate cyclase (GGDEF) domain-containing protein n=1 Tax=Ferrimonas marina TaxID=299255 RepID=A0A1M5XV32_9GAMM|nr:EAL domain-containing protein [Ferrimonas marina]SHI03616.1 diguanylate cyclase (GGDEF) domain-containing protein [Ferrimonas marina]